MTAIEVDFSHGIRALLRVEEFFPKKENFDFFRFIIALIP